jgi:hypothetical protein
MNMNMNMNTLLSDFTSDNTLLSDFTLFELEGTFYIINRDLYESIESHIERVYFILDNIKTNNNLQMLIQLSRMMINKKLLKCNYK